MRLADAYRFVGMEDVQRFRIGLGIDSDSLKTNVVASPDDADCDFTSIGDQDFFHAIIRRIFVPNSTGCALSMRISATVPAMPALTSFMTFIASMMQTMLFSSTLSPTFTKGGSSGE